MQDFKQRRSAPRKPWLRRRFRLGLRRRSKANLPKGFRPLPVPVAAKRESTMQLPKLTLVRPPLAILHGTILLWLLAGAVWNGWGLVTEPLSKMKLSGNVKLTGAEVLAAAGLSTGQSMSEVDPIAVTRRLGTQPRVAAVDVRRVYPGAVWIDVRERVPVLRVQSGNVSALVDRNNVVIEHGATSAAATLPLIRGAVEIPAPGQVLLDPGLLRAREFLRQVNDTDLGQDAVAEVDASKPYMLGVRFTDGRRALFSADDVATELRVYRDLTTAPGATAALGDAPKTIDLRSASAEDGRVVLRP